MDQSVMTNSIKVWLRLKKNGSGSAARGFSRLLGNQAFNPFHKQIRTKRFAKNLRNAELFECAGGFARARQHRDFEVFEPRLVPNPFKDIDPFSVGISTSRSKTSGIGYLFLSTTFRLR